VGPYSIAKNFHSDFSSTTRQVRKHQILTGSENGGDGIGEAPSGDLTPLTFRSKR
jgi:hypothetical protein